MCKWDKHFKKLEQISSLIDLAWIVSIDGDEAPQQIAHILTSQLQLCAHELRMISHQSVIHASRTVRIIEDRKKLSKPEIQLIFNSIDEISKYLTEI